MSNEQDAVLQFTGDEILAEFAAGFAVTHQLEFSTSQAVERNDCLRCSIYVNSGDAEELRQMLNRFLAEAAQNLPELQLPATIRLKPLRNDWRTAWKRFFRGAQVTGSWYIAPPWEEPVEHQGTLLRIDAGPSFGTGHHRTTALCLELIDQLPGSGLQMLDAGSGSGVLSIAAAVSRGDSCFGFDNDPDALQVARDNARLNGCHRLTEFACGSWELLEGRLFDYAAVNMLPERFLPELEQLCRAVKPGGLFIFSGIITEAVERVAAKLNAAGLQLLTERRRGEWSAFLCRQNGV